MIRSLFRPKDREPQPAPGSALAERFETRVRLSWLALLAERVWEALLWPFLVIAAFVVMSLLELWTLFPPLLHRVLLGGFGLALIVSFLPLVRLQPPTRQEALRRLERTAGIKHRPASSYEDRLGATPPKETAALWSAHRTRLSNLIAKLRPSWPAPRTDRKDPYAIRAALLLVAVTAMLAAGGNGWDRLRQAFSSTASGAASLLRLDAWVTPPVYTGVPPIVLADGSETVGAGAESFRALSVPERSQLIVRTHAPQGEKVSLTTSRDGVAEVKTVEPKQGASEGLVEFQVALDQPMSADVRIGAQTVSKWRFDLIKDEPPTISLTGNPTTTPRGALRIQFRADDDNGVASAEARFALGEGEERNLAPVAAEPAAKVGGGDALLEPPSMPLQLPRTNAKRVEGRATQDLTAHPWAGLKVRMTLIARDQADQSGESMPYEFVLPERNFTKPLAKAVVEQRKKLVRDPSAPEGVVKALDALTLGADKVIDNTTIYLALRNAYWRLRTDTSREGVASVVEQLWETALRIEDGELPEAERALKSAQDALMQALKDNASPEETKRLVEELRQALSQYLQALAEQQQDKGNMPAQGQQDGDQLVSQQDLDKMLNAIQNLAESGSKEMAERMLSELKDILDRLQTGNFTENAQQQRASRMMKELSDIVSDQQKLLDDTFAAKRQQGSGNQSGDEFEVSPPGPPMDFGPGMAPMFESLPGEAQQGSAKGQGESGGQGSPPQSGRLEMGEQPQGAGQHGKLGERQQSLRDKLQQMIERFLAEGDDAPDEFVGAEEAMGGAKEAIGESDLERATQQQSLALERLRQGAQNLAEQMMEGGETQAGQGPGNNGRDPLGRPDRSNRPDLGLSVKVPDEIDIQRAREVLDELRRRLGDPSRPSLELDYLERLIKPF
ncbi:MAG: TIGR02302 family protein [Methyloceanibacter sp.]